MTATAVRRLWLVRHGETEGQSSIRFHGANDVPLSDLGRAQIRALLPLLAGVEFVRVVHSPLRRAAESARILAAACGVGPDRLHGEARLREISFGACEGMTESEIADAHPTFWRRYRAGEIDTFPDGEPRQAFAERVQTAMHEIAAADWRGDLLVVAHRGTVRQALRGLLRVPAGTKDDFGVELASVTTLREHGAAWQVEALGLRP